MQINHDQWCFFAFFLVRVWSTFKHEVSVERREGSYGGSFLQWKVKGMEVAMLLAVCQSETCRGAAKHFISVMTSFALLTQDLALLPLTSDLSPLTSTSLAFLFQVHLFGNSLQSSPELFPHELYRHQITSHHFDTILLGCKQIISRPSCIHSKIVQSHHKRHRCLTQLLPISLPKTRSSNDSAQPISTAIGPRVMEHSIPCQVKTTSIALSGTTSTSSKASSTPVNSKKRNCAV